MDLGMKKTALCCITHFSFGQNLLWRPTSRIVLNMEYTEYTNKILFRLDE